MENRFIHAFANLGSLSYELKEVLEQNISAPLKFKKGTVLLREGEICDKFFFIEQGMARLFYSVNHKEVTSQFLPEGSLAIPYYSYFTQKPSLVSLDLVETSTITSIDRDAFESLYLHYPELHNLMRQQLSKALIQSEERGMLLRKLTAKERYVALIEKSPTIFLRASVEQIATYLGLTRETLSRIRSSMYCDINHKTSRHSENLAESNNLCLL